MATGKPLSARLADTAALLSMMASGEVRMCRAEVASAAKTLLACKRDAERMEIAAPPDGRAHA